MVDNTAFGVTGWFVFTSPSRPFSFFLSFPSEGLAGGTGSCWSGKEKGRSAVEMGGGAGQRVWGMDGAFGVGFFFGFWVGWFGKLDA